MAAETDPPAVPTEQTNTTADSSGTSGTPAVSDTKPDTGGNAPAEQEPGDTSGTDNSGTSGAPAVSDTKPDTEETPAPMPAPQQGTPTEPNPSPQTKDAKAPSKVPAAITNITPTAPTLSADGVNLPDITGVKWIVGGEIVKGSGFRSFANAQQRKRLVVSAVSADSSKYRIVGTSSWVLTQEPMIPASRQPVNSFTWQMAHQIGNGWTGTIFNAGDFDGNGSQDLFRITDSGRLYLYRTFANARFSASLAFGYGWNAFSKITGGIDFSGDGAPDLLAVERRTGRLYLYRGNGRGGFIPGRIAFGYGWLSMRDISLAPAMGGANARLIATGRDGRMYVYEGNGKGSFKPGRVALGYGWNGVSSIHASQDWNRDGHADLIALANNGDFRLYLGNANNLWGISMKVGIGWNGMRQILLINSANENEVWTIDRSYRLWRYTNTQNGYVAPGVNRQLGYKTSGINLRNSYEYPIATNYLVYTNFPHAADGTPLVKWNGKYIFHPVAYSRYAMYMAQNAMFTKGTASYNKWRDWAVKTGNLILRYSITLNGDELWLPYGFELNAISEKDYHLNPPWVSGMSQGLALGAFVRLEQLTGDVKWRQAADKVLATYYSRPGDRFFFSHPDPDGHLWFEEYPGTRYPSRVINGHLFAIEGLEYYWLHTHAAAVLPLADGGATALEQDFAEYRVAGRPSAYCASIMCWAHGKLSPSYHEIVANQLTKLANDTGYQRLNNLSAILRKDYWPR
ncbi:MAG: hypothetical protein MR006_00875 [Arcanobacterium sp.]|nr:hypothetical protein [Arcanobacterium sp.]